MEVISKRMSEILSSYFYNSISLCAFKIGLFRNADYLQLDAKIDKSFRSINAECRNRRG